MNVTWLSSTFRNMASRARTSDEFGRDPAPGDGDGSGDPQTTADGDDCGDGDGHDAHSAPTKDGARPREEDTPPCHA